MQKYNLVETNRMRTGPGRTYKKQGGVQVSDIFRDQVVVMFVSNFLVDGPEVCSGVGLDPSGFQACNCCLQPKAGRTVWSGQIETWGKTNRMVCCSSLSRNAKTSP